MGVETISMQKGKKVNVLKNKKAASIDKLTEEMFKNGRKYVIE